jgi:hypothetical protein
VSGFDEGSLASDAARCMRQLGQLSEALCQAERVIALRPPGRRRSRAFGMLICTDVLIARGDLDQACVVAAEVLEATDALASYLVIQQFLDLRRRFKPHASHVAVREFLARLNPTIRERLWFKGPLQGEHLTLHSPGVLA